MRKSLIAEAALHALVLVLPPGVMAVFVAVQRQTRLTQTRWL